MLKNNLDYGDKENRVAWNQQGGRLKYLQSGIPSSITSLQSFEYDYDPVGNIDWIKDYKAGGTQTQTFNYDTIDRLKDAIASGGVGGTYAKEYYTYNAATGNLASKAGVSYTYGDSDHPHAVTSLSNGNSYTYDANGNQLTKTVPYVGAQTRKFDAENRLVEVTGTASANFVYDGDGNRVKGTAGGTTTVYIGAAFEWTGSSSTMKRYYYSGSVRIAVRVGNGSGTTGLSWLLGDDPSHSLRINLGSTSLTVSVTAVKTGELRYKPYGETRYSYGSTPTTFKFTGQREQVEIGLYYYQARWFDSSLGRFIFADNIISQPGNPLDWDRYLYVRGNPILYIDPMGNTPCFEDGFCPPDGAKGIASLSAWARYYGLSFSGDWSITDRLAVVVSAWGEGSTIANNWQGPSNPAIAFQAAHGLTNRSLTLNWNPSCYYCRPSYCYKNIMGKKQTSVDYRENGISEIRYVVNGKEKVATNCNCQPGGGVTLSAYFIEFASLSSRAVNKVYNVVHEFGHALNNYQGGRPASAIPSDMVKDQHGIYNPQNTTVSRGEIWANMWTNLVVGVWDWSYSLGEERLGWITQYLTTNIIP